MEITTPRLILRSWRDEDTAGFVALCADPEVMAFFERPLSAEESAAAVGRFRAREKQDGFCMWAAVDRHTGELAGTIGLQRVPFEAHFTPAVEVGWRLARAFWGRGLATEGARAALAHGFGRYGLQEVVAMAVAANRRSLSVMERIGMQRDRAADFDHPQMPEGHRLRRHCLYRIQSPGHRAGPRPGSMEDDRDG